MAATPDGLDAAPGLLRIADAARAVGVSPSALRLWERQGLVSPRRPGGRERRYGPAELERLHRVRHLRSTEGLNAAGIRRLLGDLGPGHVAGGGPGGSCDHPGGPGRRPGGPGEPASRVTNDAGDRRPGLGGRLRSLRVDAGLSLRELAARASLSPSFVSALEHGTKGASAAALARLAGALGIGIVALRGPSRTEEVAVETDRVVRGAERRIVEVGRGVRIEELATGQTWLQSELLVLAPGATTAGARDRVGEVFMFVLAGRVAVWLDERERHELEPGDALTYASTVPRRLVAVDGEEARILWVNTPPMS